MKILNVKFNNQCIIKIFSVVAIIFSIFFLNNCEASYQNFEKEAQERNVKYVVGEEAIKEWATYENWRVSDFNFLMTELKQQQNVELDRIIFYTHYFSKPSLACRAKDDELFTVYNMYFRKNGDTIIASIISDAGPFDGIYLSLQDAEVGSFNFLDYKLDNFFYKRSSYENFTQNLVNGNAKEIIKKKFEKEAYNIRFGPPYKKELLFYKDGNIKLNLEFKYEYDVELMSGKSTHTGTSYIIVDATGEILDEFYGPY